jgi:hypothetical protein
MKILVTGATGYWGRRRANALRLHGHQVSGFMRLGLVYGNGGSYDIPHFINLGAKKPHLGSGGTVLGMSTSTNSPSFSSWPSNGRRRALCCTASPMN